MKNRIGEIGINNEGLKMIIVAYRRNDDIDIEFENGYISKNKEYQHFKKGTIKNPCNPKVYGIGYLGDGEYQSKVSGKRTIQYHTWERMFLRCYDEKYQQKNPTYEKCFVCTEWHNFQNFAEWFDKNYYQINDEEMALDKDILIKGNKIYSPETCVFVPKRINKLFTKADKLRGEYPIGVSWNKNAKKLMSCLRKNSKTINLGYYNTQEEAFQVYKITKESYIKEISDEYKNKIPQKLYDGMYKYVVEIND